MWRPCDGIADSEDAVAGGDRIEHRRVDHVVAHQVRHLAKGDHGLLGLRVVDAGGADDVVQRAQVVLEDAHRVAALSRRRRRRDQPERVRARDEQPLRGRRVVDRADTDATDATDPQRAREGAAIPVAVDRQRAGDDPRAVAKHVERDPLTADVGRDRAVNRPVPVADDRADRAVHVPGAERQPRRGGGRGRRRPEGGRGGRGGHGSRRCRESSPHGQDGQPAHGARR